MLKYDNIELEWLGHATFLVRFDGKIAYFDPFVLPENPEKADLILITHEHFDHCDPEKVNKIKKEGAVIVTNISCAKKLSGNIKAIEIGQSTREKGANIQAVHAYNIGKQFHPKGSGMGFIVDFGGTKIYHAGDTDIIPEMSNYAADVSLLPIGGTYTMDTEQAAKAALKIKTKVAVPMHFGFLEQTVGDPQKFKQQVELANVEVKILEPRVKKA